MTDADIIKALECCSYGITDKCQECPLSNHGATCMDNLERKALDLINRQQAKIEELEAKHWGECMQIAHYDDESKQFADIGKLCSEIRAGAVREFAEKLKKQAFVCDVSFGYGKQCFSEAVVVNEIDNLVIEMTGGEENA